MKVILWLLSVDGPTSDIVLSVDRQGIDSDNNALLVEGTIVMVSLTVACMCECMSRLIGIS